MLAAIQAGAVGLPAQGHADPRGLAAAVAAAASGAGVVAPDLLGSLMRSSTPTRRGRPRPGG